MKRDLRIAKCSAHGQWGKPKLLKLSLEAPPLCGFKSFQVKYPSFPSIFAVRDEAKQKKPLVSLLFPSLLNYTGCKLHLLFNLVFLNLRATPTALIKPSYLFFLPIPQGSLFSYNKQTHPFQLFFRSPDF